MTQYIDKSTLVAEIERYKHKADERLKIKGRTLAEDLKDSALQNLCGNLLYFLNNLEMKVMDEIKIGETRIYLEDDGGEPPYDGKQWLDLSCTEYEIPKNLFKDGDNVEILIRKAQKGE